MNWRNAVSAGGILAGDEQFVGCLVVGLGIAGRRRRPFVVAGQPALLEPATGIAAGECGKIERLAAA